MILPISIVIIVLVLFFIFSRLNLKTAAVIVLVLGVLSTGAICVLQPVMHKPFSIDIIEYFIKINDDGSMTTTKQVTKTIINDKQEAEK